MNNRRWWQRRALPVGGLMLLATAAYAQPPGGFRGGPGGPAGFGGGIPGLAMREDVQQELQLVDEQRERLKQIDVQMRVQQPGAAALTSGALASPLNLTGEQREQLERRADEVQQELREKICQLQLDARNKMLDVLKAKQRV